MLFYLHCLILFCNYFLEEEIPVITVLVKTIYSFIYLSAFGYSTFKFFLFKSGFLGEKGGGGGVELRTGGGDGLVVINLIH